MPYDNIYGMNPYGLSPERIDKQIDWLNQMKNRTMQPAPVQNIINTTGTSVEIEGKILPKGQTANDVIIQNRTIFIDEANKKVSIKEVDGTISKEYEIIVPLTAEQKEIQTLKERIKEMEVIINGHAENNESSQPNEDVK